MRSVVTWAALFALLLGGSVLAFGFVTGGAARSDCPGTVDCPLTGEELCQDRCPLLDAARPDCPGQVECPLTGELVCRDECPVRDASRADCPGQIECALSGEPVCNDECPLGETAAAVPACCRDATR